MPYEEVWSPSPEALVHHGVVVYHTLRHDNVNDLISDFRYTLDPHSNESDDRWFDLRDYAVVGLNPMQKGDHPDILRALIDNPDWLAEWLPADIERPLYDLTCPRCQAINPDFRVIHCNFTSGPAFTSFGAFLTPDYVPDTVTVQCAACHVTFDAEELKTPLNL
jgi:hypothetical protein